VIDVAFSCPRCNGHLIVERQLVGRDLDCPHCLQEIRIPNLRMINKDKFVEPPGLRRILQDVRDREWEDLRRKHQQSRGRVEELEAQVKVVHEELAEKTAALDRLQQSQAGDDLASLRKQVADLSAKFVQANQTFLSGRKQHEAQCQQLREELDSARDQAQTWKRKHDEMAQALHQAVQDASELRSELAAARDGSGVASAELEKLEAQLEAARLDAITAHADALDQTPHNGENGNASRQKNGEPVKRRDAVIAELKGEVANLRQSNDGLRAARDRARDDLVQLQQQLRAQTIDPETLDDVLQKLSDVAGIVQQVADRQRTPNLG
jgi:chromosome segregation ATPase